MVTGASTADLAVILIDARKGVLTQTRRHSYLVSLLGIRHVVLAVNKLDLVDYSQEVFDTDRGRLPARSPPRSGSSDIVVHPHLGAARRQHHRAQPAARPGTRGPTLIGHLETVEIADDLHDRAVPHAGAVGATARTSTSAGSPARSSAAASGRATGCASCRRAARPPWSGSSPSTATSTRRSPGSRSRSPSPTRSTSAGATSLPRRGDPPGVADQFEAHRGLDERAADAPGPPLPAQARHPHRRRHRRPPQVQGQRQHARAHRGAERSSSTRSASATSPSTARSPSTPTSRTATWAASSSSTG